MDRKPAALIAAEKNPMINSWREALRERGFETSACHDSDCVYRALNNLRDVSLFIFQPPLEDVCNVRFVSEIRALQPRCRSIVLLPDDQRHQLADALATGVDLPLVGQLTAAEVAAAAVQLFHQAEECADWADGGDWELDAVRWSVSPPNSKAEISLTFKEREFLLTLAEQPGQPVRRESFAPLFELSPDAFDPRRLEIMVRRLKNKIRAKTGQVLPLNTAHGVGYALATPLKVLDSGGNPPRRSGLPTFKSSL